MIHHFPLFTYDQSLSRQDFRNFFIPFSKIIKEKINNYKKQQQSLIAPGVDIDDSEDDFE